MAAFKGVPIAWGSTPLGFGWGLDVELQNKEKMPLIYWWVCQAFIDNFQGYKIMSKKQHFVDIFFWIGIDIHEYWFVLVLGAKWK